MRRLERWPCLSLSFSLSPGRPPKMRVELVCISLLIADCPRGVRVILRLRLRGEQSPSWDSRGGPSTVDWSTSSSAIEISCHALVGTRSRVRAKRKFLLASVEFASLQLPGELAGPAPTGRLMALRELPRGRGPSKDAISLQHSSRHFKFVHWKPLDTRAHLTVETDVRAQSQPPAPTRPSEPDERPLHVHSQIRRRPTINISHQRRHQQTGPLARLRFTLRLRLQESSS